MGVVCELLQSTPIYAVHLAINAQKKGAQWAPESPATPEDNRCGMAPAEAGCKQVNDHYWLKKCACIR